MRLYALLLLLYPREIRDRFGAGMRYAFRRDSDAARAQGLGARLAFWLTTLVESVRFGLAERLESRPHPQKQEGTEMTSAWTIDWRDAWRALRATPLVTALAVLSLALGIGANTALFSILNSLLLKPLPVAEPERLVLLDGDSWTNPIWEEIRARQDQVADGGFAWSNEIAIGTAASVWASQFVTALLYGFKPWDPLPFATAALVLTLVAGVAGWLPARRASRINPTILLREG